MPTLLEALPLSPSHQAKKKKAQLVDKVLGGGRLVPEQAAKEEGIWCWSPLRMAQGVKAQPPAGSERLNLGLGLFLLAW